MTVATQPLRDEHRELLPQIDQLRAGADAIGSASIDEVRRAIDASYAFLTQQLLPHAHAEERALYPVVAEAMGAPEATATMRRDHVEVGRLTQELADLRRRLADRGPSEELDRELRRVLYGLAAVVPLHFAKEEEVYLPLLDARLTPAQARTLFERLEAAAIEAKR